MSATLTLDITDDLIDKPRHIQAAGLAAGEAKLTADFSHTDGSVWHSEASFLITDTGRLDLHRDSPLSGDWQGIEPMGAVWALRQISPPTNPLLTESLATRDITLTITDSQGSQAQASLVQHLVAADVSRQIVRERGLSGTLFTPPGDGPFPLIIVLNGSGGGTPEQRAALLASRGYQSLALAYFKAPGRPDYISRTPLEYFQQALDWAAEILRPANGFIAVVGHSRGGELALLLGAIFPQHISAVIGYVPSDVVHGTLRAGHPDEQRDAIAWTWQGQALVNIWQNNPAADWHAFDNPPRPQAPIRQAPAFVSVENSPEHLAAARIPVERIAGPLLLISGSDDGFWPSTAYCERIVATLARHHHGWPVEHVGNAGAGHAINFPFIPTTQIANLHPMAGVVIDGGGTAAANARANQYSWQRVLHFLATATAAHKVKT